MWSSLRQLAAVGLVAAGVALAGLGGCADPEPINRVQPNLIEKSKLGGEWYILDTIVRAPFASHYFFAGLQSSLDRGVFEIEERHLYLYRTYEFIEGVEQQGLKSDSDKPLLDEDGNPVTYDKVMPDGSVKKATRYVYRSAPLAKYAISGHFDVRQSYNPITGEPTNVTVEDASEKYWWERDWMRVDFGSDTAGNSARFGSDMFNAVVYEGETGPEELKLRVQDDGAYMDFVVRGWITAPRTYLWGWGWIPTCFFYPWYTGSYFECGEEEIHIRTSLMKVDPGNTYQPWNYDDHMLDKFGFFRRARATYDQYYGATFSAAERHIQRFRIWEDYVDADGDGKLDYASMKPQPIVYYLSEKFPRELIPGAIDLADQWNEPFVEVVEHLTGKPVDGRMFVLCENNLAEVAALLEEDPDAVLAETDERYCKNMDQAKPYGDLRYNQLVSINEPTQFGLYGYGPAHSDPLTGETINAHAFQYTGNLRLGARTAVDMIEYSAGVQTFRDVADAEHIRTDIKARTLRQSQSEPRVPTSIEAAQTMASELLAPEVDAVITHFGLEETDLDLARAGMSRLRNASEFDFVWLNADMAALVGLPADQLGQIQDPDHFLRGLVHPAYTNTEDMLLWGEKKAAHLGQQAICMGEHFDDSFNGLAAEYQGVYDQAICDGLSQHADADQLIFDFSAFAELGASCDGGDSACASDEVCTFVDQGDVSGKYCMRPCTANALLQQLRLEIRRVNQIGEFQYWDPNALYTATKDARVNASQQAARELIEQVREKVFLETFDRMWSTVAMHEAGHNLGLRHNFASSTDALNYFDDYWSMKGTTDGEGHWHPNNLWSRETDAQVASRMREYQQTSIMEYSGAFNARYQGLGSYDRAAILFGYGELLEVFENPPALEAYADYIAEPSDGDPMALTLTPRRLHPLARALEKIHHTNYPAVFGGVENMTKRKVVKAEDIADTSKPCSQFDDPYSTAVCGQAGSFCRPFPSGFFCTKPDMVEVPFRFCSDEYNWSSPQCQTHDEGTDSFEIVLNSVDDYEYYWPFRAYMRDNDLFSPSTGYWNSVMSIMAGWRKHFEHWAYNYTRYNKDGWWEKRFGQPWHLDVNGGLGATLAAKNIFETMANVFGRPSPGFYGWNAVKQRYEPVVNNGKNTYSNVFYIPEDCPERERVGKGTLCGGRPMYPSYDFTGYIYVPYRAGTFYDRLAAMQFMTFPQMLYVRGVDRTIDARRFRLNFATVWPERVSNLLAGMLTGEPEMSGWCIEHDGVPPTQNGNGDPSAVKPRRWFGTEAELDAYYANCVALTPEPEYSFPTTQYRLPALASIYGLGWSSQTFDRGFADRARVWLEGEGNDVTIPAGFEVVKYTDPFSGKTYMAPYDPEEFDPNDLQVTPRSAVPAVDLEGHRHVYWPAARMLSWANRELAKYPNQSTLTGSYSYSDLQQMVGRLEIIRGLYRYFEYGY